MAIQQLFYTLYPRDAGPSNTLVLAQEPGIIPAGQRRAFAFSTYFDFPTNSKVGASNYLVLEARILAVQLDAQHRITAVDPIAIGDADVAVVAASVALADVTFHPALVDVSTSPAATPDDGWFDVQGGVSLGATQVQFKNGAFRVHVNPDNAWNDTYGAGINNAKLVVENNSAVDLRVVFTVVNTKSTAAWASIGSGDEQQPAQVLQPWVHLFETLPFGVTAAKATSVANLGTGGTTASFVSSVVDAFSYTSGSVSVAAGSLASLAFTFAAPINQVGTKTADFVLTPATDPNGSAGATLHNTETELSATFGNTEIVMLLDGSGSMGTAPNGSSAAVGNRRWDQMIESAESFLNILKHGVPDESSVSVKIVVFPDITNLANNAVVIPISPPTFGQAFIDAFVNKFRNELSPQGGTPLGDGETLALAQFSSTTANVQGLVILSDGASNAGSAPFPIPATPAIDEPFAIAYGVGTSDVRPDLLQLVVGAADRVFKVDVEAGNPTHTPLFQAQKAFAQIGKHILGFDDAADPAGVVTSTTPVATHEVTVTELDERVIIWLNWNTDNAERLSFELLSPRCEIISKGSLPEGVAYTGTTKHQIFSLTDAFLRNTGGGFDRYGTWRLVVRLGSRDEGDGPILIRRALAENLDSEPYQYAVWTKTRLGVNLDLQLGKKPLRTGDTIAVRSDVALDGVPIRKAQSALEVTSLTSSLERFIASSRISSDLFERVRKEQEALGITDFWAVKTAALASLGQVFTAGTTTVTIPMIEGEPGIYRPSVPVIARNPGAMTLRLVARGELRSGVPFQREATKEVQVQAAIDPAHTTLDVQYNLEAGTALVTVRPNDAFGNPVLFDPKTIQLFTLKARGAELKGPLSPQLDGSYTQSIKVDRRAKPFVDFIMDDQVVLSIAVPVPFGLVWVDELKQFCPGPDLKANEHANPKFLLGPLEGSRGFLSLGALGVVDVEAHCDRFSPSTVTVFVQPDTDLRPYKVEAFVGKSSGHKSQARWVELGTSSGVSQTFSLEPAGKQAQARVRISDSSGRSIQRPGVPLKTPGVSLIAVGFDGQRPRK
jgi:hypothetical protein